MASGPVTVNRGSDLVAAGMMGSSARVMRSEATAAILFSIGACLPAGAGLPQTPMVTGQASPRPRQVLFFGRQVTPHHSPYALHSMMRLPWAERDLRMKFATEFEEFTPANLGPYDAMLVYGNAMQSVSPAQYDAVEQFANNGGGTAVLHVGCWSNNPVSPRWTSIVGAGFYGHLAIQSFTQTILNVDHPILKGLGTYTSVDEPYQFNPADLMPDRTVLTIRTAPGAQEPMCWVRQQGLGRVFYHSGGHDAQTWVQPNFQEVVNRGIEWVARTGDGPAVAGIDRARIGNGGAIAVRASLSGPETRDAVFTVQGGRWHRPVLEGDTLFDLGSGLQAPEPSDDLRVGGQAATPVMAMTSHFTDASQGSHWGLWGGRGGLARVWAQDQGGLSWGEEYLPITAPPAGSHPELVMNASGTTAAQVFVSREGFPELDTALIRAATGAPEPAVLLVEGDDLGTVGSPWLCGDLRTTRLSLNGPGHLAAILSGTVGKRLMLDSGAGWTLLLQTGENVPGLPVGETLNELRDVRLNDAGSLLVTARINGAEAILRRGAGSSNWSLLLKSGSQPWLGVGETVVLPADGRGCLIDSASHVSVLAEIGPGGAGCLLKISPSGQAELLCKEGTSLSLGGESVTVSALGAPGDWSCGPPGIVCGRVTVTPTSGPVRDALVRWNGRHALPVIETGKVFHGAAGDFTVASMRLDGGGTAEDGKGGFLTSDGEWVATVTVQGGGDRLIHGVSIGDLDGDSRDDLLESALGGDPTQADSGTPLLGIQPVSAGAVLRFLKKQGGPFDYAVEVSPDLQEWLPSGTQPVLSPDQSGVPAGYQRMEFSLTGTAGFARIRVTAG